MEEQAVHRLDEHFEAARFSGMPVPTEKELPELRQLGQRFLADRPELDAPAREAVMRRIYAFVCSITSFYRIWSIYSRRFPFESEAEPGVLRISFQADVDHCMDGGCYDVTLEQHWLRFARETIAWQDLIAPYLSGERKNGPAWLLRYCTKLPDDGCPVLCSPEKLYLRDPFGLRGVFSFAWDA